MVINSGYLSQKRAQDNKVSLLTTSFIGIYNIVHEVNKKF